MKGLTNGKSYGPFTFTFYLKQIVKILFANMEEQQRDL
jgi:hypothetical protein